MNRRAASLYLGLTLIGVMISHIGFEREDNGMLLSLDGKHYDVVGAMVDMHTSLTARCDGVTRPVGQNPTYIATLDAVRRFSPPDSASARIASLMQYEHWLLAELEFDTLLPAVVLLHEDNGAIKIQERAIWSGTTRPWKAGPLIRNYISRQAPDAPAALFACFTPLSNSLK